MGCTAGCLSIYLEDEKYLDVFAKTFVEIMDDYLYEPMSEDDVMNCFDTNGDIAFTLDAEPIFAQGHGDDQVTDFLLSFIKKAPDVVLSGDYYSDYNNCCDIVYMQFEYSGNKLSLMCIYSEIFGVECEECGAQVELSDVEIDFKAVRRPECPECGAPLLQLDDKELCGVYVDDIMLVDGEWVFPEGKDRFGGGDECLTDIVQNEIDDAHNGEDQQAADAAAAVDDAEITCVSGQPEHSEEECAAETVCEEESARETEAVSKQQEPAQACCTDAPDEIDPKASIRKKKSKWWIVLLIVVLIALAAAAFHFFSPCLL